MQASGVYEIKHVPSGRRYVGSSKWMSTRWKQHKRELKAGLHHSKYLQRVWDSYPAEEFSFSPLLVCEVKDLIFYEQFCLDNLSPVLNGLKKAVFIFHPERSEDYKKQVSVTSIEKWAKLEYREKVTLAIQEGMTPGECAARKERTVKLWKDPEYRARAIAARTGRAYIKGYKCTPSQVLNRQKAARISNMKRNYSPDWKAEYLRRYPQHAGDIDAK